MTLLVREPVARLLLVKGDKITDSDRKTAGAKKMRLPERLTTNSFAHWNFLVRGLMEMWEVAYQSGWEADLERLMEEDEDGKVTEELGRLGNELLHLQMISARSTGEISLWTMGARNSPLTGGWLNASNQAAERMRTSSNSTHL